MSPELPQLLVFPGHTFNKARMTRQDAAISIGHLQLLVASRLPNYDLL